MKLFRKIYFVYFLLLLLIFVCVLFYPLAFQKSNTIIADSISRHIPLSGNAIDISSFLRSIPYSQKPNNTYQILPQAKYKDCIVEGDGNCSNLSFAAAYYLCRKDVDYAIVHLLPRSKFLIGVGHTVVHTRYSLDGQTQVGIIDVLQGGIPQEDGRTIDIDDLEKGGLQKFSATVLNSRKLNSWAYYDSFLDDVYIGYIPGEEVNRYFHFIETIYIPLGNEKLEKYTFDGISLVMGFTPKIYVKSITNVFEGYYLTRLFFILSLWIIRSAIVFFPLIVFYELKCWFHHRAKLNKYQT